MRRTSRRKAAAQAIPNLPAATKLPCAKSGSAKKENVVPEKRKSMAAMPVRTHTAVDTNAGFSLAGIFRTSDGGAVGSAITNTREIAKSHMIGIATAVGISFKETPSAAAAKQPAIARTKNVALTLATRLNIERLSVL
jgi:hypothetical protein